MAKPTTTTKENSKPIEEPMELEGGDMELETEEPEPVAPKSAVIPTLSTKVDPVEKKNSNLSQQLAAEIVELAKDVSRPISALKSIVQTNLAADASREEAQAYYKFFERLKRVAESAYLTAQELTSTKL